MSNIIGYWDENGREELVPSTNDNTDAQRREYIQVRLVTYMKAADGETANASIDPAFEAYIEDNGGYRYTGIEISYPSFTDLQMEIYSFECPCLIGFPVGVYSETRGHSTTGIGYSTTTGNKVKVFDNHSSYAVYQSWDDVDFMFSCNIRNPI